MQDLDRSCRCNSSAVLAIDQEPLRPSWPKTRHERPRFRPTTSPARAPAPRKAAANLSSATVLLTHMLQMSSGCLAQPYTAAALSRANASSTRFTYSSLGRASWAFTSNAASRTQVCHACCHRASSSTCCCCCCCCCCCALWCWRRAESGAAVPLVVQVRAVAPDDGAAREVAPE